MPPIRKTRGTPSPTRSNGERALRIAALLFLVAIFAVSGLQLNNSSSTTVNGTSLAPTAAPGSPTALTFPTVAPNGTALVPDYTYFHSSGAFSIPHLVGWDLPGQGGEESTDPSQGGGTLSRAGATFINSNVLSVVHIFAENDPKGTEKTLADLDKYYDKANLTAAWTNFTGGYKETGRRTEGDQFVIDFQLFLTGNTYLARQISRFDHNWLIVIRLVAPDNNPQLLDQLEKAEWTNVVFYPNEVAPALTWQSVADTATGYLIKFPPTWNKIQGAPGTPFVITGTSGGNPVTMTTRADPGKSIKTEADARAWITAQNAQAVVTTIQSTTSGDASGFNVSYNNPDRDGNARSDIVTLLNGTNGTLYSTDILSAARGVDLLSTSDKSVPPELAQIRASYMLFAPSRMVATLTPTITPTVTATLPITGTPTNAPTVAAIMTSTPAALPTAAATRASAF